MTRHTFQVRPVCMRLLFALFIVAFATFGCDSVTPVDSPSPGPEDPVDAIDAEARPPVMGSALDVFAGEPALRLDLNAHLAPTAFDTVGVAYRIAAYDSAQLRLSLPSSTTLQLEVALAAQPSVLEVDLTATTTTGDMYPITFEINVQDVCQLAETHPNAVYFPVQVGQAWSYHLRTYVQGQAVLAKEGLYDVDWHLTEASACHNGEQQFSITERRVGHINNFLGNPPYPIDTTRVFAGTIQGRFLTLDEYITAPMQWLSLEATSDTLRADTTVQRGSAVNIEQRRYALARNHGFTHIYTNESYRIGASNLIDLTTR
ncbi:MAG: hypothetical protein RhofKO_15750 [Rhodothermales bacterium]